ncbi:hypothetical protein EJ08DRAFT_699344 [Tothia fuscella]|uniref:MYND-type domain-containing protein n=1 Tax=Tothia fuscella TaxID=1048955 RepID=A0A9P4NMX4_9PEZI|nr:hypothetical protein EJ08DRAFT_699344 [Tothia fuscella]
MATQAQDSKPSAETKCAICEKHAAETKCASCKQIHYCSRECQKEDWSLHKKVCKIFENFDHSSKPGDNYVLTLFFPVDDDKPRLVWHLTELTCEETCLDYDFTKELLNVSSCEQSTMAVFNTHMEWDAELEDEVKVSETIRAWHRPCYLVDGSLLNQCIFNMVPNHYYRGPFLVHHSAGIDESILRDITPTDFCRVMKDFADYADSQNAGPRSMKQ